MGNTVKCPACDFANVPVKSNAKGTLSATCPDCGYQAFIRSPKGVNAMRLKMSGGEGRGDRVAAGADDDDWLKKL